VKHHKQIVNHTIVLAIDPLAVFPFAKEFFFRAMSMLMSLYIITILFPLGVHLRNWVGAVDRDLVHTRARQPRNERYFSKPKVFSKHKMYSILL
jgi:hypothetical protein